MEYRYQFSGDDKDQDGKTVHVERQGNRYRITIGGHTYEVAVEKSEPGMIAFTADGQHYRAFIASDGNRRYVAFAADARVYELTQTDTAGTASRRRAAATSENVLSAAMPGQVVKVLVADGENVKRGQTLVLLEAMKMEIRVTAPRDAQVIKVLCKDGQIVERGQRLVELSG